MKHYVLLTALLSLQFYTFSMDLHEALREAADARDVQKVKELLHQGADATIQSKKGQQLIIDSLDCPELVETLLAGGADPDTTDYEGSTLLHTVAQCYKTDHLAKILINHGATVDKKNKHKTTPLHTAAEYGHNAIVQLLINAKANVNKQDNCDRTSLYWAAVKGHASTITLLLQAGAKLNYINMPTSLKHTALYAAADSTHKDVVQALLDAGANPFIKDEYGRLALDAAKKRNQFSSAKTKATQKAIEELIEKYTTTKTAAKKAALIKLLAKSKQIDLAQARPAISDLPHDLLNVIADSVIMELINDTKNN